MNQRLFREIGLTDIEIKVYLALLSRGASPAGKLVRETALYRGNVYDALGKLVEKGLVTFVVERKVRRFQPKDPENLLRYLEAKRARIFEQESELKRELPGLKGRYLALSPEIESEIYRGTEGIKTILKECLRYKEVLFIGATGDVETRLPFFWPHYNEERIRKKCRWRLLLAHEARNRPITKSKYYTYKVLPELLSGLNVIYIYGEHVANVLWLEKPVAFVIRHAALAANYRKYFHYLWASTK